MSEPRTAAGRALLEQTTSFWKGHRPLFVAADVILAIEAEAAGAALREALEALMAAIDGKATYYIHDIPPQVYQQARAALAATPVGEEEG